MASVARVSSSLRTSLRSPAFNARVVAFQGARYYSAKSQVCGPSPNCPSSIRGRARLGANNPVLQSLKERFAELLPEKIEQIKALRKFVSPLDAVHPIHLPLHADALAMQGARLQGC